MDEQLVVFVVLGFFLFFLFFFLFLVVPVGISVGKVLEDILKVVQPVHQVIDIIIRQAGCIDLFIALIELCSQACCLFHRNVVLVQLADFQFERTDDSL
ncbi:MAG: hypothetical protein NT102_01835 [Caldiserica bacterium]|nr:hypothetical protein [Caldisericota bacterium]